MRPTFRLNTRLVHAKHFAEWSWCHRVRNLQPWILSFAITGNNVSCNVRLLHGSHIPFQQFFMLPKYFSYKSGYRCSSCDWWNRNKRWQVSMRMEVDEGSAFIFNRRQKQVVLLKLDLLRRRVANVFYLKCAR